MSDTQKQSGWVGWAVFGGIVVIIVGVFNALLGLAAVIGPDSAYFANTETGALWLFDVAGWGWWHLLVGLALAAVGVFVLRGASWARITAVVLVVDQRREPARDAARLALVGADDHRARHPRDLRAHRARQGTRRHLPLSSASRLNRGAASFGVRRPFAVRRWALHSRAETAVGTDRLGSLWRLTAQGGVEAAAGTSRIDEFIVDFGG